MSIELSTHFNALRMVANQPDPMMLEAVVRSSEKESKTISVVAKLPFALGFDKVGLMREKRIRAGNIEPGETRTIVIEIYCKRGIQEGNYEIPVSVDIHPLDRFDKVERSVVSKTTLRVISR